MEFASGVFFYGLYIGDLACRGAVPHHRDKFLKADFASFGDCMDSSIMQVLHVSFDSQFTGCTEGECPVSNPLYDSAHGYIESLLQMHPALLILALYVKTIRFRVNWCFMSCGVVLLSSGLDSVVAFKMAFDRLESLLCLTFDYGQRAAPREIEYSRQICERFDVQHRVVELPWYRGFKGALTGEGTLPRDVDLDGEGVVESAQAVWVPARNLVMLSIAAAYAENYDMRYVVVGLDAEEAATFPDNSEEFVGRFNKVLRFGTMRDVEVWAPLIEMDKKEIVCKGISIGAPLDLSWSCYEAGEVPCGQCESCQRRGRAFEQAGKDDPLLSIRRWRSRHSL